MTRLTLTDYERNQLNHIKQVLTIEALNVQNTYSDLEASEFIDKPVTSQLIYTADKVYGKLYAIHVKLLECLDMLSEIDKVTK